MARPDLVALTPDSLASLANRGLVKRAVREVADGRGPAVHEGPEGTVTARFADGVEVVLPPATTVERAHCSCGAPEVCRHRVMLVLAYQQHGSAAATATRAEDGRWSPGSISDGDLEAHLGSRVLAVARKARRAGYRAEVRRAGPGGVSSVELPSCTVQFLVPGELAYARVDAARGTREDAVALAVWAFRAADTDDPDSAVVEVAVGGEDTEGRTRGSSGGESEAGRGAGAAPVSGVEPALGLLSGLLGDGVVHAGPSMATAIVQARRALDSRNLRWPVDTLDDVADQLEAYRQRSARYRPEDIAAFVAELVGRHRCVVGHGASLRPGVLGTEEAAETPLRLVRLQGLGARVSGRENVRTLEVYLAHAEAGVVLALRRRAEADPDTEPPTAAEMGRRRAGGTKLSVLAAAHVVTGSAVRSASRVMRIAESRMARTTVSASPGDWEGLPASILVGDLDAEGARLAGLAPAVVRPRVVAEAVRVVAVDEVEEVAYLPGAQEVVAAVRAPAGKGKVVLTHSAAAPGAVDALAKALAGDSGPVRFVAGHLRRVAGGVVIEPTAVVAGEAVIVPAFAPTGPAAAIAGGSTGSDPLATAVAEAVAASAEVVHRGWRHVPRSWVAQAERSARQLHQVGLERAARSMVDLVAAAQSAAGGPSEDALDRWADTHLRLLVTAEQL